MCFERSLPLPARSELGSAASTLDLLQVCPRFGNSATNLVNILVSLHYYSPKEHELKYRIIEIHGFRFET